jgi:hypothetical protein
MTTYKKQHCLTSRMAASASMAVRRCAARARFWQRSKMAAVGATVTLAAAGQAASCSADSTPTERVAEGVAAGQPPKRLAVGGVRGEYRTTPRAVSRLEPPLSGFFSKEIIVRIVEGGAGVPIRAHECVADGALFVAADRLGRMLRYLPVPVLERLQRRGAALHVIGIDQGCSDLPEHGHMKGVDGGYTGESGVTLDQRARGMGGTLSSCGEENLIDLDTDPRYAGRDILMHEFGHCVMDVGLPPSLHAAIGEAHHRAVAQGKWVREDGSRAYAGTCAAEYWAELTMWYFGSHGEFVDWEKRLPTPGPGGLSAYDPEGFALLSSIYNGTHPGLGELDPPATQLLPLDVDIVSSDVDEQEAEASGQLVLLELDNAGCGTEWELFWVDAHGAEHKYGVLPARVPQLLQQTYPGHVWLVRAPASAPCRLHEMRYAAATGRCVASVARDAGCSARESAGVGAVGGG